MKHRLFTRIALTVAAVALIAPAAQAATSYDGYKSSFPQLRQLGIPDTDLKSSYAQLHELGAVAGVPGTDLKSSYRQLHQVLSGSVQLPAGEASAGVDWRDAGLGALVGALGVGLLGAMALRVRRSRLAALH